jgi:peptidoglycan/LPS O-acetylase OafA/YrhL
LDFLVNLFSLQGIAGKPYGSNGALWTLSIEVQFYALYPLLLAAMVGFGRVRTLIGLALLNIGSYLILERHSYLLFSSYYVSWYLGALVAEADVGGVLKRYLASRLLRMCGLGLSLVVCCAGFAAFFLSQYAAFQFWAVGFAGLLAIFLNREAALQGTLARLFRWFGSFSYSIYIVHLPFVVLLDSILYHSQKQASPYPFYLMTVAAVGCAYAFSLVFEKPALALSKFVRKHRARRVSEATTAAN